MSVTNIITERTITGVNESEDLFLDNSSSTVNNTGIVERDIEGVNESEDLFLDNSNSAVNNTGAVERDVEGINESEDLFLDNSNSTVTNTGVTIRDIEGVNESEAMFPDNTSSDILNIGESVLPLLKDLEDRAEYYENEEDTIDSLSSNRADLLSKASLIMTPTAYSDGELHSVKPIDGVGDFNFSRNSSATRINEKGLIEEVSNNIPRINYSSGEGALLLEPSRTNLITYSEDFTTGWGNLISGSGTNPIVTSNQGISPDGSLNADKVVFDLNGGTSSSDYSLLDYSLSGFSNPHTLDTSIYLKSSDGNDYQVAIYNRGTSVQIITVTSQWQRFSVNGTRSNTTNNFRIGLFGDNSSNTASLLLFGTQAELGSYATSYIPTEGSTKTRLQDVCNNGGNEQVINSTEGVLYAEISALANDLSQRQISIDDGVGNNRIILRYNNVSNNINAYLFNGSVQGGEFNYVVNDITEFNKIAFKFKQNDFSLYVNGTEVATDTSGNTFSANTLKDLSFDFNGNFDFYGNVKDVRVYNTALTDAELIALTQV